jgi:hypothetical protein
MLYLIIWHSLVLKKQQLFPYQIIYWNYFEIKKICYIWLIDMEFTLNNISRNVFLKLSNKNNF